MVVVVVDVPIVAVIVAVDVAIVAVVVAVVVVVTVVALQILKTTCRRLGAEGSTTKTKK